MAVVSISRQFGAGGKTLAEKLAQRLGYDYTDQELVERVAKAAGVSDEWVRVTERESAQKGRGGLSLLSTAFLQRVMGQGTEGADKEELNRLFSKIIPEIAARNNVVFLGRGSQFILPGGRRTVKILLVAPLEYRVRFMMDHYNLSQAEAAETVRDWDQNRKSFLNRYTERNPDEPGLYDLTLNTSVLRSDWALDLMVKLIQKKEEAAAQG
jgi:cytidylate kinase